MLGTCWHATNSAEQTAGPAVRTYRNLRIPRIPRCRPGVRRALPSKHGYRQIEKGQHDHATSNNPARGYSGRGDGFGGTGRPGAADRCSRAYDAHAHTSAHLDPQGEVAASATSDYDERESPAHDCRLGQRIQLDGCRDRCRPRDDPDRARNLRRADESPAHRTRLTATTPSPRARTPEQRTRALGVCGYWWPAVSGFLQSP